MSSRPVGFGGTQLKLHQSGQTPDDGEYRWMGSVAMDKTGDIALGYSRSSANPGDFPSIYYAGPDRGRSAWHYGGGGAHQKGNGLTAKIL